MNIPKGIPVDEDFSTPSSAGLSYKYADLPNTVEQTPAEVASTGLQEAALKDTNLARIDKELSRPGISVVAKKTLMDEKARLSAISGSGVPKGIPFGEPVEEKPQMSNAMKMLEAIQPSQPGAQSTDAESMQPARNPIESGIANSFELWKNESLPAHLYNAQQKGVFNKPLGELIHGVADSVKNFSISDLWDAVKKDPGKFGTEMAKSVWADPYLLFAPMGLGGKVAGGLEKLAGAGGKFAGNVAEVGTATAGIEAPINVAKQLDEKGFVDPAELAQDMGVSFGMGSVLGGVLHAGGLMGKSRPKDIANTMEYGIEQGDSLVKSLQDALEVHNVPEEKAQALIDSIEKVSKESPDLEADFKKMRGEIAPLLEEEPPVPKEMTSAQARTDLGAQAAEMKAKRLEGEQSDASFEALMEDMRKQEAERTNPPAEPIEPQEPSSFRNESAEEGQAAQQRIQSGETQGYGEEPSALAARLEQIKSKKTLTPSQAKEALDIQTHLDSVLPFQSQRGNIDPEMLKWMGLGVGGAALGGYFSNDKAKGAAIGAALALGGGIALKAGYKLAKDLITKLQTKFPENTLLRTRDKGLVSTLDNALSAHEGLVSGSALAADRLSYALKKLVPDAARREAITRAIDAGQVHTLSPNERIAAELYQKETHSVGEFAQQSGVMGDLIDNYVTHLYKNPKKAQAFYSSVRPDTKFAKGRKFATIAEAEAAGLEPKTLDVAELAKIYGQSIGKTIANKKLLKEFEEFKLEDKNAIISVSDTEPFLKGGKPNPEAEKYADYVTLDHPQMRGKLVSPEIAPALSHVFYSNNVPAYLAAMTALSSVAKRGIFSLSGFHIKSLLDVGLGLSVGAMNPKALTKIPSMYRMIKEGKAGDFADQMMRSGLKIDPHNGIDMDNDVFRSMMNTAEQSLQAKGILGKVAALPLTAMKKLDNGMQFLLWDYLHPSMKLAAASAMFEKRMLQNSKALNANPQAKVPSVGQIQREIADATNDLFGGINWRRVSGEVENEYLHGVASSLTNPAGLRAQRVALLAPDWTVATARTGYKGIKSTLKGLTGKDLSASEDMYRRYFLGSALLYATLGDGLNVAFSGHHLWENKDPTYVDLGDGRKLQLSKHFMEPFHWMQHPGQTMINKMGYVPKEGLMQAMGKEFLSEGGGPPMDTSVLGRAAHAAKGMAPITTRQKDLTSAALGFGGFPITGESDEDKEIRKRQGEIERRLQRKSKQDRRK